MYYRADSTMKSTLFSTPLNEQDILPQDLQYKETVRAGGYLGERQDLPEPAGIARRSKKSLITATRRWRSISARVGVLAIGKPLESAKLRMQISQFLKTPQEIESNNDFIWDALNRITEPAMLRALAEQQTVEVRGWLELNLIVRRSNMLPVKMEPWIDQWYQRYGEHAAAPTTPSTCWKKASVFTSSPLASH